MLLTFATKNYEHWLELLLKSYRKTNPEGKATVYIIADENMPFSNCPEDQLIKYRWIPAHESINMIIADKKVKAALRLKTSIILWELILNPGMKIIWADADSIVLNDVRPLLDKLNQYDFLGTFRPWKPIEQQKLAAGVMGVRSNSRTVELFARASRDVWGHWEGWYSDQLNIYNNLTSAIRQYDLQESEHSLKNTRDTIIMSHHSNGYDDLKKYCIDIGAL